MNSFIDWLWPFLEALGITALIESNQRIYYPYLLSTLTLAIAYYLLSKRKKSSKSLAKLLHFLFPKTIWLHQSAIVDYQLFVVNNLLKALLIAPFLMAHAAFAYVVVRWWDYCIGIQDTVQWSAMKINIIYTFVYLIVSDFSRFILHYCLHKFSFLWQFHKVHHSAEVLTPITVYRVHPVEYILFKLRSLVVFGLVTGSFFFWFRTSLEPISLLQIHIGLFLFNLLGANLRHSHVPIRYGNKLEHIFISPAQHQLHHGSHPRFFDKNFGSLFAIWDWLLGSLSISKVGEKIDFGIEAQEQAEYRSLWQNLLSPIRKLLGF